MFNYTNSRKSINDICNLFNDGSLIIDESYQRRSVWGEKDKIRLVETVLLKLVIPELFFWKAETDPDTGASITHIVDGQQRIKALSSYVSNVFKLKPQYLLSDEIKAKYANKFFKDLDADDKRNFWNYQLMVIDIDPSATRDDIIIMFNRLNLTDYSLNDQEKRNSKSGEFASLARELSEMDIWDQYHLFTVPDVKRMKDVEFCASLILLYKKGIIDQTNQTALNEAYEEYQTEYKEADSDKEAIIEAINLLPRFFIVDNVTKFLKKRTQLYTLFSVIFYMQREERDLEGIHIENLRKFVELYSVFGNDIDLDNQLSDSEKIVFDWLKRYKLASSEGLNKHTNRMIRYNVLKEFIFNTNKELASAEASLYDKIKDLSAKNIEDPDE